MSDDEAYDEDYNFERYDGDDIEFADENYVGELQMIAIENSGAVGARDVVRDKMNDKSTASDD